MSQGRVFCHNFISSRHAFLIQRHLQLPRICATAAEDLVWELGRLGFNMALSFAPHLTSPHMAPQMALLPLQYRCSLGSSPDGCWAKGHPIERCESESHKKLHCKWLHVPIYLYIENNYIYIYTELLQQSYHNKVIHFFNTHQMGKYMQIWIKP